MPRIPVYFHQTQPGSPQTPRISPHALDAEFAAGQNIAHAASKAAETAGDIDMKFRDAREASQRAVAKVKLQEAQDRFVEKNQDTTDFDNYVPNWEKHFDQTVKDITPPNLSARGQRAWQEELALIRAHSIREMQLVKHGLDLKHSKANFDETFANGIKKGNAKDAEDALAIAVQKGVTRADAAAKIKAQIPALIDEQKFYDELNKNAVTALRMVRDPAQLPNLDPHKRHTLSRAADGAVTKQKIRDQKQITDAIKEYQFILDNPYSGTPVDLKERKDRLTELLHKFGETHEGQTDFVNLALRSLNVAEDKKKSARQAAKRFTDAVEAIQAVPLDKRHENHGKAYAEATAKLNSLMLVNSSKAAQLANVLRLNAPDMGTTKTVVPDNFKPIENTIRGMFQADLNAATIGEMALNDKNILVPVMDGTVQRRVTDPAKREVAMDKYAAAMDWLAREMEKPGADKLDTAKVMRSFLDFISTYETGEASDFTPTSGKELQSILRGLQAAQNAHETEDYDDDDDPQRR